MSFLRTWLLGVTAAALAVALAQALTPEGTVKKALRLIGGLVLVLAVVKPLTAHIPESLVPDTVGLPAIQAADKAGEEVMKTLIAQKAGAYIVDKGSALGLTCTAEVTAAEDESGWPVPWSVTVSGNWTGEQKRQLSRAIAEELDIPEGRQTFQKEGP